MQVRGGAFHRSWPLLWPPARLYRATLARRPRAVAVIGTYGKTTTTRAVAAAMGGDPDAIARNAGSYLATAIMRIRPWARHAVLEVGVSTPGEMARYAKIVRPAVVVVTSIGSEHGPRLGPPEQIRHEKADMVRSLGPGGLVVANGDDEHTLWMAAQTDATVITCGFGHRNDVRATEVELDWPDGTRFVLHAADERRTVRARLLGQASVWALLAAVGVALAEGRGLDETLPALENLPAAPGRLQAVALPGGAYLLRDEYKSPIETVDAALDLLAEIPAKRRVVVLGDVEEPPEPAQALYPRIGRRVSEVADRAVYLHHYPGGPRYTDGSTLPADAVVDARGGIGQALAALQADLRPGDVVLVKGGHAQKLDRLSLGLAGSAVGCRIPACRVDVTRCAACPMLERGWGRARVVT